MQWKINNAIDNSKIEEIISMIDMDLLINRLCFTLNMDKTQLYQKINLKELELLIATMLINRNYNTPEKINKVFNSVESNIINPYNLINAEKAADKIIEYLDNNNSTIYIYGDYDLDGVSSLYVLTDILQSLTNITIIPIFPNRKDGYGINIDFCNKIIEKHKNENVLVITVDNGITKKEEVKLLKDNGIEVIITDHHPSKLNETPENCIIVDPYNSEIKQNDTFHHLCGCGVAFKIGQIIKEKKNNSNDMIKYTPFLALATLGDVMPMNDENTAFIEYGLEIINSPKCPVGIKELMKQCKIDILTVKDILWTVSPMINACGRLGNTELAGKLFFTSNTIEKDIKDIKNTNEKRKDLTKNAKEELNHLNFDDNKVCIITTTKFPAGILGIIAGKAMEKFNKPSIVASITPDGYYHGSIRSINNINMIPLLKDMKEKNIIVDYGGHPNACVCTFDKNNISLMNEYFNNNITEEQLNIKNNEDTEILNIDEIISTEHLNEIVFALINLLPCDNKKNKNPIFSITNLKVIGYRLSKNNKENIEFTLKQDKKILKVWAWGFASKYLDELKCSETIHLAGEITKSFMGNYYTLNVIDIMKA